LEWDNEILAQVKDLLCNVKADVKEIQSLKENMEKLRMEIGDLRRKLKGLKKEHSFQIYV